MFPTTITATQANKETPIGEMFTDLKPFALGSQDPAGTSGLTFGVHGGPMLIDGVLTTIADQTTLLDASSTCYVEWTRAGVISDNTTGFTAGRLPLYVVTTSASGVSSFVDWRVWQRLPGVAGRLSVSVAGSADVTLTAAQARNEILHFTGVLTGDIDVIVPNGPQVWSVFNATTGSFTLTLKTAAGTGTLITQGKSAVLLADGTNVVTSHDDLTAVGAGDVVGPGSSVTNNLAHFDNTTGKLIGDSGVAVSIDGTLASNSDAKLPTEKATKTYVDNAITGLSWKQAVRAATTAALTLATDFENGDTIDGVVLATGNRILVKNQASATENGIYVVAASGAPARASDADSGAELVNASVYVSEGTTLADTQWTCSTNATITIGATNIAFAQLTSGGGSNTFGTISVSGQSDVVADSTTDTLTLVAGTNITITTNAGTDTITITSSGGGSTQGLHDMPLGAASWYQSYANGATSAQSAGAANQPDAVVWQFDPTTAQSIWTVIEMPKSWDEGTITFHLKWMHAATATNFGVVFQLRAVAMGDGDAWAATFGTAQTVTDTGGTTLTTYSTPESSAITVAGTPQARDLVYLELMRLPSDGSDTLAVAAQVMSVTVQYTTNADTDA